jgi:hypothetical protein
VLWTCKRCGLVKTELTDVPNIAGGDGSGGAV